MKLTLVGHDDRYAVEQLLLSLFSAGEEITAISSLHRGRVWLTATTKIEQNGQTVSARRRLSVKNESVRLRRQLLQQSCYLAALKLLPNAPAWGALAGVRPTKLSTRHLLDGGNPESARKMLCQVYYVTPERSRLAVDCSASTVEATKKLEQGDISLYVGIPFCPTRCSYCSFVSSTIGQKSQLLEPYLQALHKEIQVTGRLLANSGQKVRTIYIGGGTPTTLSTSQISHLLDAIKDSFDLSRCVEFTVEGGRPDTLTQEKLTAIYQHGADRMSINPQTMVDSVLAACRRPHSAEQVCRAYEWAKNAGFSAINMDLIAGLPTDDYDGFCYSLDAVAALNPANITVHTLALKKGADLFDNRAQLLHADQVSKMVDYSNRVLSQLGYKPYYLYRQKYMSGSFENVGWSRDGLDCLYNIYMMEEIHTILSLGGGGMNKVNLPNGSLQRFHNPKFPEQYISQLPQVLRDKEQLFELMKGSI